MNNAQSRPALGQAAEIGTLYDAATDCFVGSIFGGAQPPDDAVIRSPAAATTTIQTTLGDTYKDKFALLGVSPDLGASALGGLLDDQSRRCPTQDSLAYLCRQRITDRVARAALLHRLFTVKERFNRRSENLGRSIDRLALQDTRATHVVVAVEWGAETIVEATGHVDEGQLAHAGAAVEHLKSSLTGADANGPRPPPFRADSMQLEMAVFGQVLTPPIRVQSVGEAEDLLRHQVPQAIQQVNMGKGYPIVYRVLPISFFMGFLEDDDDDDDGEAPPMGASFTQISSDLHESFRATLDGLWAAYRRVTDYSNFLSTNRNYVSPDHSDDVGRLARDLEREMERVKTLYGQALRDVRTGSRPSSILEELRQSVQAAPGSDIVNQQHEKVRFVAGAVSNGAMYIGHYTKTNLADLLRQQVRGDAPIYALSFSQSTLQSSSWPANKALLVELLDTERKAGAKVIVEDCDATGQHLDAPLVAEYRNGTEVTADLVDRRKYVADKCFAQCGGESLEVHNVQKPVRRRFVKIPCPGARCDGVTDVSWMCPRCFHPLEYGHSDKYFYCDCGRSHFSNYAFRCNNAAAHGPSYTAYRDESKLQSLLQSLASSDYVNILILGETGVGKSTFINAFINYLTFGTLDDALKGDELQWVIPCSFQTQVMDRSRPDGRIIQHKIIVGDRDDEHDGSKGDSATQQTSVYPINIGSKTIRLIDTPGIGDTRGVQYDKKNMADILATLNSYEELHGILILLKSNSARLTITFEFCVKELLTHLHRSAVNNIAFGFTNTRISNYTPGDTFGPLETLLAQQPEVQLSLTMQTSYCFDSESFRYLAAHKQGVKMENEEDFRRSWKHSSDESRRLVDFFQSKHPHCVTSTISLNGTRQLILELTKPLADISQLIRKNIAMCQDRERELADTRLTGDALRKKLQFERLELREKALSKPRTVCTSRECIENKDDGTGKRITDYKSHCHRECYLDDIPTEVVAFPGLIHCWAFDGKDHCRVCSHHWRMHLHILAEFEEFRAVVTDTRIAQDLAVNATDSTLRQKGVQEAQQLIREYQHEHAQVQSAAAQFGLYLKKHSITAYNDVTLDYLDMLINQEKEKIEVGGGRERLDALRMDRSRHEELVAALTARMQQSTGSGSGSGSGYTVLDEAGVDAVVRRLYGLKHFGATLKTVQTAISAAHAATYRERPYHVGSHKHRPSKRRQGPGHSGVSNMVSSFASMMGLSSGAPSTSSSSSKGVGRSASKRTHAPPQQPGSGGHRSSARSHHRSSVLAVSNPPPQLSMPDEPPPPYRNEGGKP